MMGAFISVISLTGLLFIVFFLHNQYRVDRLRQQLFELRDELFLADADEKLSLQSPAYQFTRTLLNGLIRFGHRLSWSRWAVGHWLMKPEDLADAKAMRERAFAASTEAERALLMDVIRRANVHVMLHMASSPALMMLFPLLPLMGFMRRTKRATVALGD